jgi:hypothetical protein
VTGKVLTFNAVTGAVVKGTIIIGEVVTDYCSDWRNTDRYYSDWSSGKII